MRKTGHSSGGPRLRWPTLPATGWTDLVTHDGLIRKATLFVQYRDSAGELRLKKDGPLKLDDGREIDDSIVGRRRHWTESFRCADWDNDGLLDLIYSCAGSAGNSSIYLLHNVRHQEPAHFRIAAHAVLLRQADQGDQFTARTHGSVTSTATANRTLLTCVEWSVLSVSTVMWRLR